MNHTHLSTKTGPNTVTLLLPAQVVAYSLNIKRAFLNRASSWMSFKVSFLQVHQSSPVSGSFMTRCVGSLLWSFGATKLAKPVYVKAQKVMLDFDHRILRPLMHTTLLPSCRDLFHRMAKITAIMNLQVYIRHDRQYKLSNLLTQRTRSFGTSHILSWATWFTFASTTNNRELSGPDASAVAPLLSPHRWLDRFLANSMGNESK